MVVSEAAATMNAFSDASLLILARVLYCTVQYIIETSDYNSIEPTIQGGVKE
jgi:hypothetical protein